MTAVFGFIYTLLVKYAIPFLFAIGLIHFLYGAINYFIIGPGEEPVKEEGRIQILWAFILFSVGILIYACVAAFVWVGGVVSNVGQGVDSGEELRIQLVPNVPTENN